MEIHSLYSSSSGNSCCITSGETSVFIDAGVSYKRLQKVAGDNISPKAVFITHAHGDHVSGAGVLGRKTQATLYMPHQVHTKKEGLFKNCDVKHIMGGDDLTIDHLHIKAYSTRHDSDGSVGYVITDTKTGKRFGYLTDAGSFSKVMKTALLDCDAYLLEADYDEKLLEEYDGYDVILKQRIAGPWGHLSNTQTLDFIEEAIDLNKVQWIIFGHLSSRTNSPDVILSAVKKRFPLFSDKFGVAPTKEPLFIT